MKIGYIWTFVALFNMFVGVFIYTQLSPIITHAAYPSSHKDTLLQEQAIFAQNVAHLINYIFQQGYQCSLGEAWRTSEQADWDVQHHIGIKNSLHCERLAIDINLFDMNGHYLGDLSSYEKFGVYWESLHPQNRWGGRFEPLVDMDHFEMRLEKSLWM